MNDKYTWKSEIEFLHHLQKDESFIFMFSGGKDSGLALSMALEYGKPGFVNSNIEACQCLLRNGRENSIAITNKLCADYYVLNIIKELRNGVFMPWICFMKMERGNYEEGCNYCR